MDKDISHDEPVALVSSLTAAVVAPVNIVGLVAGWDAELIAGINIAAAAWVGVAGFWVRSRVTPTL